MYLLLGLLGGRGIDVVRQRIKMFGQTRIDLPAGCHKIVFLDEADGYG